MIQLAKFVFDSKMKGLKVLHPFGMPSIELVLPLNVFKRLTGKMDYELRSYKLMTLMF